MDKSIKKSGKVFEKADSENKTPQPAKEKSQNEKNFNELIKSFNMSHIHYEWIDTQKVFRYFFIQDIPN